jgi:Arylsulfotransferase (ASST)
METLQPGSRGGRLAVLLASLTLAGCGGSAMGSTVPAILFSPIASTSVYLMGLDGQQLHEWHTDYAPGYSAYLLPTGSLLRADSLPDRPFSALQGSNGGRVEMLDWNSDVVWRFDYATTAGQQHHDVFWMPTRGHVLMVAWERRTNAEALAAGRRAETLPAAGELWVDKVVEVDPVRSQVVWEWRTWDHLVPPGASPADHPGLVDPNYVSPGTDLVDWTHANAVFYDAALDQVMLSVRNFSEFWILDHSTTTAEAAGHGGGRLGHGGDIVYRWGNPRAYGLAAPQQLFGQHNAQRIADGLPGAGHVLVFNNGDARARPYSTVVELVPPVRADGSYEYDPVSGYGPSAPVWQYVATPPQSVFAPIISGAQRLASGNTLVTVGTEGRFLEVTPDGQTVWSYVVTDTAGATGYLVFRAQRYEPGFEGLARAALVPEGRLRITPATAATRATIQSY